VKRGGPDVAAKPAPPPAALRPAPSREEADRAFTSGRYAESAAAYEALLERSPDDGSLLTRAAIALHSASFQETRRAQATEMRVRARRLAQRARALGQDDPLLKMLVDAIREDGTPVEDVKVFSLDPEVQAAMTEGEAAFSQGDTDAALRAYRRALAREPRNYAATLFIGDVYFTNRQWKDAVEWFRKAVALSPDVETAHRYLADALTRLGLQEEALDEYVEAVIADPYGQFAAYRLLKYVQNVHEKPPLPGFAILPVPYDPADPKAEPFRDAPLRAYADAIRRGRKAGGRRTLAIELAALEELSRAEVSDPAWRTRISQLAMLRREGFLEAYALLHRADDELRQDYVPYRDRNRQALRRFLRRYWCGVE
jgi:tetratricopeptide (TPR) repeat protein